MHNIAFLNELKCFIIHNSAKIFNENFEECSS